MRIFLSFTLLLLFCFNTAYSQRAKIKVEAVTPYMLSTNSAFTADSTVSSGMKTVANKTFVYLSVFNFGNNDPITNATWSFISRPPGSNAVLTPMENVGWWVKFRADTTGMYEIKVSMTTATGTKDTTTKVYSSRFVGVGGFAGVPQQFPNCMTCHNWMPKFTEIFNRWKVSKHATKFQRDIDGGAASYSVNCLKCHTIGYDRNLAADNNGFDDVARRLGWSLSNYLPPQPGNFDTIVNRFPELSQYATIGCESCHGPGSEHALVGGDTNRIAIDYSGNNCSQCHDSPWRHSIYRQWKNAKHSNSIWSNSFAQASNNASFMKNNLDNCIRCHDGRGYINFTNSKGTNTQGMTKGDQTMLACATCHDPHGNSNEYSLRNRPAGSDTLATGYSYNSLLGKGKTCADCHKSRKSNFSTIETRVTNAQWGPHNNTQTDMLLGRNAAQFNNIPYMNGSHRNIENSCVTCHMSQTTDTGTVMRDFVGGHSLNLHFEAADYDHVKACQTCHPGITKFDDLISPDDFDGNGVIESWRKEIDGCMTKLKIALPPVGIDSVAWQLVAADSLNVDLRKAYWNYLLISKDGSGGMHNPFFTVNVLLATIGNIVGIEYVWNEIPVKYELSQNYPNPFNPETKLTFSIPKTESVKIVVYDMIGREVAVLVNEKLEAGKFTVSWNAKDNSGMQVSSGVYFYKFTAGNFVETKRMVLIR
jgi:hypothetical protein